MTVFCRNFTKYNHFKNSFPNPNLASINILKCQYAKSSKLGELVDDWKHKFEEFNIPEIGTSLQLIVSHVLSKNGKFKMMQLNRVYSTELTEEQVTNLNRCCECRLARMPVQYIIQEWEFRNATLKMIPPVFIPRPETELLIDTLIKNTTNLNTVLEIGCGSGAISISLLQEIAHLQVTAIDQSKLACNLTSTNAKLNKVDERLKICQRKLSDDGRIENLTGRFDAIVSNPPYLFSSEVLKLEPEVKLYEDIRALDGGIDGLQIIKAILEYSANALAPTKCCFIEIHTEHVKLIQEWLDKNKRLKLGLRQTFKDFLGYDRFVCVVKTE